jgi:hypothetical protein
MNETVSPAETTDQPVTRYFSFGGGQRDPKTGESLRDKYATVIAADADACRTAMFAVHGREWCGEYVPGTAHADKWIPRWTQHELIDATGDDAPKLLCTDCGGLIRVLDGELVHVGEHGRSLLVESHDAWVA